MDEYLEKLRRAGLSGNEAKVYFELLRRGSISANELAKKLGMDRTLAYQVLSNLIEKGLVNYVVKENKKFFKASEPENLLDELKEKEKFITDFIPELKKIEKLVETEQAVNIYEGKKGLKILFQEIIKSKNICIFGATGKSYSILKYEIPHIIKDAQKLGLNGRMITNKEFKNHEMTKLKGLKTKYVNKAKSQNTATTIYSGKVAIHSLSDKPLIIIIKNKDIYETYKSYFEILWKTAKN